MPGEEGGRPRLRRAAGCMTGTSLDGLDAVLAEIEGEGLGLRARYLDRVSRPLGSLGKRLLGLASGESQMAQEILRAARELGELHAAALEELQARSGAPLDLIALHGQTVCHLPGERMSWQLLDPWPVARRLRAPVVYDLRQADLQAGGEGAPLTPLADWVLFRDARRTRLVVNLGGISNFTLLPAGAPPEAIEAGDAGPCNLLLDGIVRILFPGMTHDRGGELALRGRPDDRMWEALRPHLAGRRSLGREQFGQVWLRWLLRLVGSGLSREDLLASAAEAAARAIAAKARTPAGTLVILAGGGARNAALVEACARRLEAPCVLSDELGVPAEAREGLAFAVLGALSQDRVPISLPRATGATAPGPAGAWIFPVDR